MRAKRLRGRTGFGVKRPGTLKKYCDRQVPLSPLCNAKLETMYDKNKDRNTGYVKPQSLLPLASPDAITNNFDDIYI
jgi:hypothetical protein